MADRDQAASEADQRVSNRDQDLADREWQAHPLADRAGGRAREEAMALRGEGTIARMATTAVRAQVASERLDQAWRRDEMAHHRDEVADARDREADEIDAAAERMAGELGADSPAAKVAAVARASAAAARARAAEDRERAARDREDAARDRELLMAQIERAQMDEPTGAYGRRIGEALLRHEVDRAQAMGVALALGLVTFEAAIPAEEGAHGDVLARDLFLALQTRLRLFDPIVRWGEGEFACGLSDVDHEEARDQLADACSEVANRHPAASTAIGVALDDGGSLEKLIERAKTSL